MKNLAIILLAVLTLIIAILLILALANPSNNNQTINQVTATPVATITAESSFIPAAVNIRNFNFSPAILTVPVGTTVTWQNNDADIHTLNSELFDSPELTEGEIFSYTFMTPGTYDYICALHPSMKGQVLVQGS